jgi:hypothetical protein
LGIVDVVGHYCDRYSTREDALIGHQKALAVVRAADKLAQR